MTYAGYIEAQCVVPSGVTLEATNDGGGPTTVSLTPGSYFMLELVNHVQNALNIQRPGTGGHLWSVSLSLTGSSPTGKVTFAMSAGGFGISWVDTDLEAILGFDENPSGAGGYACPGVFIPDRPLNIEDDPRAAPMLTDLRETESPTGFGLAVVGNAKYVHNNIRWAHVSRERYLNTDSGVTPSWERFVKNTQLAQGHPWFRPRSKVKIADQTGALIGSSASVTKWWMRGVNRVAAKKQVDTWTGAWLIEIPSLVSDGS